MKCRFELQEGIFCRKNALKGNIFCLSHVWVLEPLYFTTNYAGYKKFDSKYIEALSLKEWCLHKGVALQEDKKLQQIINRIIEDNFRLKRTSSQEKIEDQLRGVRLMIAEKDTKEGDMALYRFFYTYHEPHHKVVQEFINHPWFTATERTFLRDYIEENFIENRTIKHQLNTIVRNQKQKIRQKKKTEEDAV